MTVKRYFPNLPTCKELADAGIAQDSLLKLYRDGKNFKAVFSTDTGFPKEDFVCAYPTPGELIDELLKKGPVKIDIVHEQQVFASCNDREVEAHSISEALARLLL